MKVVEMDIFDLMYEPFKFDTTKPIKLFEAFSGIGTQYMALKRLQKEKGFEIEVVGISEVDKFAIASYESIHGKVKNYGGIGSFERFPKDIDIATWSFPCQDISLAGKQSGMVDGSRSNYGYVFLDTVKNTPKNERPKVLLMENVRALFSEKFKDDWREIQLRLEEMGYKNYSGVLNAKNYGIAQNRVRVFIVSILGDYNYTFPKGFRLKKRLKDYLESEIDEKYFLSDKMINYISQSGTKNFKADTKINLDVARALTTAQNKRAGVTNYIAPDLPPNCDLSNFTDKTDTTICINSKVNGKQPSLQDRIYDSRGIATAITTSYHPNVLIMPEKTKKGYVEQQIINGELRIRKLTEREAWRLMGIDDEDFEKAEKVVSSTQLYKQAGNAIVVDVLMAIFKELF